MSTNISQSSENQNLTQRKIERLTSGVLSIVETPDHEVGQIIAGGAFGLFAGDVIFECRDSTLVLMSDETEETAMRRVTPSLLYVLADDNH